MKRCFLYLALILIALMKCDSDDSEILGDQKETEQKEGEQGKEEYCQPTSCVSFYNIATSNPHSNLLNVFTDNGIRMYTYGQPGTPNSPVSPTSYAIYREGQDSIINIDLEAFYDSRLGRFVFNGGTIYITSKTKSFKPTLVEAYVNTRNLPDSSWNVYISEIEEVGELRGRRPIKFVQIAVKEDHYEVTNLISS